jgi:hypothetical protein
MSTHSRVAQHNTMHRRARRGAPGRAPRACVWIGLNVLKPRYSASNAGLRSALTGSGCRSSSSVGGGYFSGRIRCRNDTGSTASEFSHLSDTTCARPGQGHRTLTGLRRRSWAAPARAALAESAKHTPI